MTANRILPRTTSPTSLVASCAPLLGFVPADCVVAFVLGVPDRPGPVLVRLDLGDPDQAADRADELAAGIAGTGGTAVDLVAWVDAVDDATRLELPSEMLLDELDARLYELGVDVTASLSTNGRVWWSHDCPHLLCCGGSRPLDEDVLSTVRAEYVYAGYAPLASRDELAARLARDEARSAAVAPRLGSRRAPANLERWREAQIGFLTGLLVPDRARRLAGSAATGSSRRDAGLPIPAADVLRALRGLADVRVRDVVLRRLIVADQSAADPWRHTVALLEDLVRCAPAGAGAPAATLLGIVTWMRGEGAQATIALARAEEDDPKYRLAELTRQVITRGTDPAAWRATMSTLTEAECRGRASARQRPRGPRRGPLRRI